MLNTDSIKRKVSVAISNAPTTIDINRQVYIDDGIGGKVKDRVDTFYNVVGLLDNSSSTKYRHYKDDPGKREDNVQSTFYLVCNDYYSPEIGDYFTIDNIKYVIGGYQDILNLHIYWDIKLEMEVQLNE